MTSNPAKIAYARTQLDPLGISFRTAELDFFEPQTQDISHIARQKGIQAFDVLREPVVVSDHGWFIQAVRGFPGAYMKDVNQWFEAKDFLRLMEGSTNRAVKKTEVICYVDHLGVREFTQDFWGVVLEHASGEGTPAMQVISMNNGVSSVSEAWQAGQDPYEVPHQNWHDLATFLQVKSSMLVE